MDDTQTNEPRTHVGPWLKALLDLRWVTWSGGKPQGAQNPPQVHGRTVAETLLEDRR